MKYRKKPVVIEAVRWNVPDENGKVLLAKECNDHPKVRATSYKEVYEMCGTSGCSKEPPYWGWEVMGVIDTLEGKHIVIPGDYIIKGVKGEFYPCKPDIFEKTYSNADDTGSISDGYHTFDELYYHRMMLFAVICNTYKDKAWKSKLHADGTMYDNYFIVGIDTRQGQYSYHFDIKHWDMFNVKELPNAPEWDGHNPEDIGRLCSLVDPIKDATCIITPKQAFLSGFDNKAYREVEVEVTVPDCPRTERIINTAENFAGKQAYYEKAYNDNLELKSFPAIKIVNYKFR